MIYVLEDDKNIRKLLSFALTKEGYEVEGFEEAGSMYRALNERVPRLLLLDVMLPGDDGFTVLQKLRSSSATEKLPIIMLTAKNSEIDKLQGLDGGADDYVTKPFGIAELTARIRAVLRRSEDNKASDVYSYGFEQASLASSKRFRRNLHGTLCVDDSKHLVTVEGREVSLSQKEYALLLMLLKAEGRACSREELLRQVWGENYGESRTLDVHIRKLRKKLAPLDEMIVTVKGMGYRLSEE
ncbi:MAG: response regulator transcription factor [Lachnospiraceae bacterium]|nr:response regulator transcription factor [Lachnospiraceae bacterium]